MIFILWICVAITAVVFGVMLYSIATFPKAHAPEVRGAGPAMFRRSTLAEVLWALVPVMILFGMAAPAVKTFVMTDQKSEVSRFAADSSEGD
jgi:cytochrome c oxidase subunit 2